MFGDFTLKTRGLGNISDTVDGSEIRRSPVEVGSLSHYLQGFIHPRWLARFLPSRVCPVTFSCGLGIQMTPWGYLEYHLQKGEPL